MKNKIKVREVMDLISSDEEDRLEQIYNRKNLDQRKNMKEEED